MLESKTNFLLKDMIIIIALSFRCSDSNQKYIVFVM